MYVYSYFPGDKRDGRSVVETGTVPAINMYCRSVMSIVAFGFRILDWTKMKQQRHKVLPSLQAKRETCHDESGTLEASNCCPYYLLVTLDQPRVPSAAENRRLRLLGTET